MLSDVAVLGKGSPKLIFASVILASVVFLLAVPVLYRAPCSIPGCNSVPDQYQSVTRFYMGIGGEDVQGHYTFYWSENLGIPIT
ncbi:hypothetical protein E6H27_00050 [Candidatus Bathyarchaeota archaeon]|nr:MAG: hypothetical protein E6H27_00050 [Candidatus Bathyarchaeota archaeon]TMI60700.1 MAG: hypothetical protein E6H14_00015 [Candidatus Bathyarchaeota archaeon]